MAGEDRCESWETWNILRGLCSYSRRLTISAFLYPTPPSHDVPKDTDSRSLSRTNAALDLTNPLPATVSLGRWSAEPIRHIFLPCTTFIPNAKGYPVLSKSMQAFLKSIFKVRPLSPQYRITRTH